MAVLIKGKSITCSQKSRDHYLRGKENEQIKVLGVRGFATNDAEEALSMIELSAKGTRCQKPLYSAKINPEPGRPWSKAEVERSIEVLEENLGLKGHGRVVVEHTKHGRVHYHVLWDRFPPEGGPAKNMGNDYAAHQKTQKQLEKEFKLTPMMAKGRNFKDWEVKWAKRYGYDIFELRKQISTDFNKAKSGQQFHDALKARGCILCRGDKGQFVLILPWGQHKALSSMMFGRPIKSAMRRALADIDIQTLPTVEEGKASVRSRLPKTTRGGTAVRLSAKAIKLKHPLLKYQGVLPAYQAAPSKEAPIRFEQPRSRHTDTAQPTDHKASGATHLGNAEAIQFAASPVQVATDVTDTTQIELPQLKTEQPIKTPLLQVDKAKLPVWKPPPVQVAHGRKGWPEAAILDWEAWGKRNPARFFAVWPELSSNGPRNTF